MMNDRKWWAIVQRGTGKRLATGLRPTRRETIEAEAANVFQKNVEYDAVEISAEEAAAHIASSPEWVKQIVALREKAVARPVTSFGDLKPSEVPAISINGWRLRLSLDVTDAVPMFHMSAQFIRGLGQPKMKDVHRLGSFLDALGAIPRPNPIDGPNSNHFRWPADVDIEPKSKLN